MKINSSLIAVVVALCVAWSLIAFDTSPPETPVSAGATIQHQHIADSSPAIAPVAATGSMVGSDESKPKFAAKQNRGPERPKIVLRN